MFILKYSTTNVIAISFLPKNASTIQAILSKCFPLKKLKYLKRISKDIQPGMLTAIVAREADWNSFEKEEVSLNGTTFLCPHALAACFQPKAEDEVGLVSAKPFLVPVPSRAPKTMDEFKHFSKLWNVIIGPQITQPYFIFILIIVFF